MPENMPPEGEAIQLLRLGESLDPNPDADDDRFQEQLNAIRKRYPNQWVVYSETWDDQLQTCTIDVQGPFECMKQAVDWTQSQDPQDQDRFTIFFASYAEPNTYRAKWMRSAQSSLCSGTQLDIEQDWKPA
jgi:hypothetical protein